MEFLYELFVGGAMRKGWGGPSCRSAVPLSTHIYESIGWMSVCYLVYRQFRFPEKISALRKEINLSLVANSPSSRVRTAELCLAFVHFSMFAQLLYFKSASQALIWIIQPCHMVLLMQGIALYSDSATGVLLSVCMLPAMTGTLLAMLFPDSGGLDLKFELEAYWLQHYLIQLVPLYLLTRYNFLGAKLAGPFTVLVGVWTLLLLHFSLYEIVDLTFDMNVEFMLCPTAAMRVMFVAIPRWMFWPSYRSLLTYFVFFIAVPISYFYIYSARMLSSMFGTKSDSKKIH